MPTRELKLLPVPQRMEFRDGRFTWPRGPVRVCARGVQERDVRRCLDSLLEGERAAELVSDSEGAALLLSRDEGLSLPAEARDDVLDQAYVLEVEGGRIAISARSAVGLHFGLQTLRQIEKQNGDVLPALRITDWPDMPIRALHLTLGSGHMPTFEKLKELLETLSRHKMNVFVMEYDDRFPFERHPALVHPSALTKDEIRALVDFAADRYVEIIPLLDSLGHAQAYLRHEQYRHLAEVPGQTAEMCPSNPETLDFIKELWTEILDVHSGCRFAHITGDEVFRLRRFCPRCAEYAETGRLSELYCGYYRDLSTWILELGRRPIMWADMVLAHPEKLSELPKEIIFNDWDYRGMDGPTQPVSRVWGGPAVDKDHLHLLAGEDRARWEPYLVHASTAPELTPFPYVRFLQDQGFEVLGASATSGGAGPLSASDFADRISNNKYFAKAVRDTRALGVVNTFWSGQKCVLGSLHGVLAGAGYGWRFVDEPLEGFLSAVERVLFEDGQVDLHRLGVFLDDLQIRAHGYETRRTEGAPVWLDGEIARLRSERGTGPLARDYARLLAANAELARVLADLHHVICEINGLLIGEGEDEPVEFQAQMNLGLESWLPPNSRMLQAMGTGDRTIWGVPFRLVDPAASGGRSALGTRGERVPDRPERVAIPLSGTYEKLFFLHTGAYARPGASVGSYRVVFADGTSETMELVCGKNIHDWYGNPPPLLDGVTAWEGRFMGNAGPKIQTYMAWWTNPRPGAPVAALEAVGTTDGGYNLLLAVTGRRKSRPSGAAPETCAGLAERLQELRDAHARIRGGFAEIYGRVMSQEDAEAALHRLGTRDVPSLVEAYEERLRALAR